jgi:hypothetical protein
MAEEYKHRHSPALLLAARCGCIWYVGEGFPESRLPTVWRNSPVPAVQFGEASPPVYYNEEIVGYHRVDFLVEETVLWWN